jgi:hypothetical protein
MYDRPDRSDALQLAPRLHVSFQRTLRIPDDGKTYPLPPGLGEFPIRRVADYAARVPAQWREAGGVFIPMYQREAMWIYFDGAYWRPNAVKVGVGGICAVSGKPWDTTLRADPQDYLVVPDQPWLDGINAGEGFIRQFVAMPLGGGYTVEAQLTGREDTGGLQLVSFEPKPGRFPSRPPTSRSRFSRGFALGDGLVMACEMGGAEMGLGAGGRMRQSIYPDAYGIDTWDTTSQRSVRVHIANSMMWREITGEEPPATPVSARTYTDCGLPWFEIYDEHLGDLAPPAELAGVKSIKQMDAEKSSKPQQDDSSVPVAESQVIGL